MEEPRSPLGTPARVPSPKAQSWGVIVSIVVIVAMIVIGAFYAWGRRTAPGPGGNTPALSNVSSTTSH